MLVPNGFQWSRSLSELMVHLVDPTYDKFKFGGWKDHNWELEKLTDSAILYAAMDAYAVHSLWEVMKVRYERYANSAI